jgi:RNA polymerase sigma factor (sigma-70 family)
MYQRHLPVILRYLRRRLGDHAAEDAAAEVFTRALAQPVREHVEIESTLPWLYGIAANVISERRRTEQRRLRALERLASDASRTPTSENPEPLDPALVTVLRALPDAEREALLLVAWGGLSYEQVAVAMDTPIGTVRSRIARARRRLDSALVAPSPLPPRSTPTTSLDPHA